MGTVVRNNTVDSDMSLLYANNCDDLQVGANTVGPTIAQRNAAIASTGPREPFRSRLGLGAIPVAFASSSWVINGDQKHVPAMAFDGNPATSWRSAALGRMDLAVGKPMVVRDGAAQVDLGEERMLRQVSLRWKSRGLHRESRVLLSVDCANWAEAFEAGDDEVEADCAFKAARARFVRVESARAQDLERLNVYGLPEAAEQWLAYDFGTPTRIEGVEVTWGSRYARTCELQGSGDGQSWTTLVRCTDATGGVQKLDASARTVRYVRLLLRGSNAPTSEGAFEIREVVFTGVGKAR